MCRLHYSCRKSEYTSLWWIQLITQYFRKSYCGWLLLIAVIFLWTPEWFALSSVCLLSVPCLSQTQEQKGLECLELMWMLPKLHVLCRPNLASRFQLMIIGEVCHNLSQDSHTKLVFGWRIHCVKCHKRSALVVTYYVFDLCGKLFLLSKFRAGGECTQILEY